jgi:hypothetical protein
MPFNTINLGASPNDGTGDTLRAGGARINSAFLAEKSFDLSWLATLNGSKFVITGDSLSYNRHDFDATARTNAFDSFPGMMSWSFMLRDFIYRTEADFEHADQMDFIGSAGGAITSFNDANPYLAAFNNRYVGVSGSGTTSSVYFQKRTSANGSDKITLHLLSNPVVSGDCKADVYYSFFPYTSETLAGTIDARTETDFQGFGLFRFTMTDSGFATTNLPVRIRFTNFRLRNDGAIPSSTRGFFLQAIGSKDTPVYLTGRGGWKASDISADFNNRIGQYSPDVLIMITGANDRFTGTKEQWAAGMVDVIEKTLVVNPNCQCIMLTPMPASDTGYAPDEVLNGSTMKEFLAFGQQAAVNAGAGWFNNYELFYNIDPAIWRFDNVHMTKRGNKILFDSIVARFFAASQADKKYYEPLLQANPKKVYPEMRLRKAGQAIVKFSSATNTWSIESRDDKDAALQAVNRINANTVEFVFNYNISDTLGSMAAISNITLQHFGGSGIWVICRASLTGGNSVRFFLLNVLTNLLLTDADNNNQQYIVQW